AAAPCRRRPCRRGRVPPAGRTRRSGAAGRRLPRRGGTGRAAAATTPAGRRGRATGRRPPNTPAPPAGPGGARRRAPPRGGAPDGPGRSGRRAAGPAVRRARVGIARGRPSGFPSPSFRLFLTMVIVPLVGWVESSRPTGSPLTPGGSRRLDPPYERTPSLSETTSGNGIVPPPLAPEERDS